MTAISELIWKLVKNSKQVEITEDFLKRIRSVNVGDTLEVNGFWNKNSLLLRGYSEFTKTVGPNRLLAEIRTVHEPSKGQRFLISLTNEQRDNLGMLDDYAYLFIKGKKRKCPRFSNEKLESIWPNLYLLEVEEIKRDEIKNYYENDVLIRNFDINQATNLLHQFVPDNHIAEGSVLNLLNVAVEGTGRTAKSLPLVFNNDVSQREMKNYLNDFKNFILQLVDEPPEFQHTFKVNLSTDKKIHDDVDWIITGLSNHFEANNKVIRSADAPILIRDHKLPFQGIALHNFEADDLAFLKLFRKLALVFKSATPSLDVDKFDKSYVEGFIDSVNEMAPHNKYYYLGLSLHDRIISSNLSIGYGRRIDIANTISKSKDNNLHTKFDTRFTFAEDLVRDLIDNRGLVGNDQEIKRDGAMLDKKGWGSFRREIIKVRNLITGEGGYSIEQSKLSKVVGSSIRTAVVHNLEEHGLLLRRLDGKISLHPSLFK